MQAVEVEGFLLFKKLHRNIAVRLDARHREIFFHAKLLVVPKHAVMCEGEAVSVNMTKERMIVLVKLRIALCSHTGVAHDDVHSVGNMNLHLPSGKRTLVNPQTVIEVVRNAGCVRAAHLAFTR